MQTIFLSHIKKYICASTLHDWDWSPSFHSESELWPGSHDLTSLHTSSSIRATCEFIFSTKVLRNGQEHTKQLHIYSVPQDSHLWRSPTAFKQRVSMPHFWQVSASPWQAHRFQSANSRAPFTQKGKNGAPMQGAPDKLRSERRQSQTTGGSSLLITPTQHFGDSSNWSFHQSGVLMTTLQDSSICLSIHWRRGETSFSETKHVKEMPSTQALSSWASIRSKRGKFGSIPFSCNVSPESECTKSR